jgi:hypothetical protein
MVIDLFGTWAMIEGWYKSAKTPEATKCKSMIQEGDMWQKTNMTCGPIVGDKCQGIVGTLGI